MMSDVLDKKRESSLQEIVNIELFPATPEVNFETNKAIRIPLADLSALGVAFLPLTAAVQTAVNGSGGSGIYFVNTMGKQMFHAGSSAEYIGSLMSPGGRVGGGQARMTALPCDPTMLFMAAALINIERKLDVIQQTQEEILQFLEEKERAELQGNLNVLGDVLNNFKYNWDNEMYKTNKHILVQQIKKEAESSIILYRDQIGKQMQKRSSIHGDLKVKRAMKKLLAQFKDYQLALYLYAYSAFLEVILLGNFNEGYLNSVEGSISEYSYQYRTLYTDCYNLMEEYSSSSVQAEMLQGMAEASKLMGETVSKVPMVRKVHLDEKLVETAGKFKRHGQQRTFAVLRGLKQIAKNVTDPFAENIRIISNLYNKPVRCMVDENNIYVQQA